MKRTRVALVLAPFILLTGCGSATTPSGISSSPVPVTTLAPTTTPATTVPPRPPTPASSASPESGLRPPTSTREVEVRRTTDNPPLVLGARFAAHEGFDRVVIDLRGGLPGYSVRWVPKLVQDGSGDPIDVKGGAYLQVTITPANAHGESGSPTWVGGPIFQADLGNVQTVVKTGDFEAVVGVGIVLDHKAGFRVLEQRNPQRLIVDVAH
ncbi:hypothetical protein AB0395_16710 [Streptosporangium sp. NPDC051023]|uniref:AMIN-like domain-containing (lipo)protein n=1 Tax=Streptosporangium sp. NPDC051023 TaxID=3155410 RepID=UPI00344D1F35